MLIIMLQATDSQEAYELRLEHSLASLSRWEAIHEKAFYNKEQKPMSPEETLSYIEQMVLNENPPKDFLDRLTFEDRQKVLEYINSRQTATWFHEDPNQKGTREIVTAELIYYWMINFQIPFSCENWHVNRLMTLIKICGIKQTKPKRMSRQAVSQQYSAINAQRREQLGTAG